MAELIPWLKQWHNEYDPQFGDRPGEAYALWLDDALQTHGLTRAALDAWEPPRAARRARRTASRTSA
jgi:phage-related protein